MDDGEEGGSEEGDASSSLLSVSKNSVSKHKEGVYFSGKRISKVNHTVVEETNNQLYLVRLVRHRPCVQPWPVVLVVP